MCMILKHVRQWNLSSHLRETETVYDRISISTVISSDTEIPKCSLLSSILIYLIFMFHITIISVFNVIYVLYRSELSSVELAFVQIFFAFADTLYERLVVKHSMNYLADYFKLNARGVSGKYSLLLLFLNIAIPIISTIVLDELCFANPKRTVVTSFDSSECTVYTPIYGSDGDILYYNCSSTITSVRQITLIGNAVFLD